MTFTRLFKKIFNPVQTKQSKLLKTLEQSVEFSFDIRDPRDLEKFLASLTNKVSSSDKKADCKSDEALQRCSRKFTKEQIKYLHEAICRYIADMLKEGDFAHARYVIERAKSLYHIRVNLDYDIAALIPDRCRDEFIDFFMWAHTLAVDGRLASDSITNAVYWLAKNKTAPEWFFWEALKYGLKSYPETFQNDQVRYLENRFYHVAALSHIMDSRYSKFKYAQLIGSLEVVEELRQNQRNKTENPRLYQLLMSTYSKSDYACGSGAVRFFLQEQKAGNQQLKTRRYSL